ncbi:MAG: hypothetical protein R3240_00085 [Gammaproteobacteria bacterium]|nr:hypothetical protein [Gammaproteobacteria bacterium]
MEQQQQAPSPYVTIDMRRVDTMQFSIVAGLYRFLDAYEKVTKEDPNAATLAVLSIPARVEPDDLKVLEAELQALLATRIDALLERYNKQDEKIKQHSQHPEPVAPAVPRREEPLNMTQAGPGNNCIPQGVLKHEGSALSGTTPSELGVERDGE